MILLGIPSMRNIIADFKKEKEDLFKKTKKIIFIIDKVHIVVSIAAILIILDKININRNILF